MEKKIKNSKAKFSGTLWPWIWPW